MKWLFNVVVATRRRFYARDRKENGTIFGSLNRTVETNLRSLILIRMPVAQILRSSTSLAPLKISVRVRVPRISILLRPSRAERFSFHYRYIGQLEFSHDLTRQFRIS
jgi:hypothetical protein